MSSGNTIALIGMAGALCGILFGYLGYQRGLKKDHYKEGETDGALKADIQYMKRLLEDVLLEQRNINEVVSTLCERVTRVEESSKQAHKRIDEIKGGKKIEA